MKAISLIDRIDNFQNYDRIHARVQTDRGKNAVAQERLEPTPQKISEMVSKLNRNADLFGERVQFSYNEKINRVIVKVVDQNTNEIVREIPAKDMIALLEHIQEHLGVLFDTLR